MKIENLITKDEYEYIDDYDFVLKIMTDFERMPFECMFHPARRYEKENPWTHIYDELWRAGAYISEETLMNYEISKVIEMIEEEIKKAIATEKSKNTISEEESGCDTEDVMDIDKVLYTLGSVFFNYI